MLGIPLHYLMQHPLATLELASDPVGTWTRIREEVVARRERRGPQCQYKSDPNWEAWFHSRLGLTFPSQFTSEFQDLWPTVMTELKARGIRAGPESFQSWNDGDAGFVRAIWCLVRCLQPKNVVETGVAHGVTSRFILEALVRNGDGCLWSIDLPPIEKAWQSEVGVAVPDRLTKRWTHIKGLSRLRLPELLKQLGEIELFVHDSMHSERNVRFELDQAWAKLKAGGAVVVDDVDANWGFHRFTQTVSGYQSVICDAEPLRPDVRRFNRKGLFGILLKERLAGSSQDRLQPVTE
jgi:hypothetical protein